MHNKSDAIGALRIADSKPAVESTAEMERPKTAEPRMSASPTPANGTGLDEAPDRGADRKWPTWLSAVTVACALLGVVTSVRSPGLGCLFAVLGFGTIVSWTDITQRRIPNLVSAAAIVTAVFVGVNAQRLLAVTAAGVLVGASMLVVHLVDPRGLGFGDVKYAAALSALVAVIAPVTQIVIMIAAASCVASVLAVAKPGWKQIGVPLGALLSFGAAIVTVINLGRF